MKFKLTDDCRFLELTEATELEFEQLRITLTKRIKNWRFNPRVKAGHWDGYFCYLYQNRFVPAGLWKIVFDMCKKYNYPVHFEDIRNLFDDDINQEDFNEWAMDFFDGFKIKGEDIRPRDYQLDSAFRILKFRKCAAELATSAGKTLISFMVVAYMLEKGLAKRILFIVPNVSLVVQAYNDFLEYNFKNRVKLKMQMIYSGQEDIDDSNIVIGTYQSLVKKKQEYFDDFDAAIVDECLHPDTLILMSDGTKKKISEIKEGEWVKTTNDKTLELEDRQVDYVYKNLSVNNQMYEIEMEDGSKIKITGNHKVKLITGEYKRVDELHDNDEILSFYDI